MPKKSARRGAARKPVRTSWVAAAAAVVVAAIYWVWQSRDGGDLQVYASPRRNPPARSLARPDHPAAAAFRTTLRPAGSLASAPQVPPIVRVGGGGGLQRPECGGAPRQRLWRSWAVCEEAHRERGLSVPRPRISVVCEGKWRLTAPACPVRLPCPPTLTRLPLRCRPPSRFSLALVRRSPTRGSRLAFLSSHHLHAHALCLAQLCPSPAAPLRPPVRPLPCLSPTWPFCLLPPQAYILAGPLGKEEELAWALLFEFETAGKQGKSHWQPELDVLARARARAAQAIRRPSCGPDGGANRNPPAPASPRRAIPARPSQRQRTRRHCGGPTPSLPSCSRHTPSKPCGQLAVGCASVTPRG